MEWDWTSYALQVINFLVLAWLLHKLFYRPVMQAIDQRQKAILQVTQEARDMRSQAEALQADLRQQWAEGETRRASALAQLNQDMAVERQRRMDVLDADCRKENDRRSALAEARVQAAITEARSSLEDTVYTGVGQLLQRVSGPEMGARLLDLLIEDLPRLSAAQLEGLRHAVSAGGRVEVLAAHALPPIEQARLQLALEAVLQKPVSWTYTVAPELVAGLRVGIGPWQLAASVADELVFFRQGARHG